MCTERHTEGGTEGGTEETTVPPLLEGVQTCDCWQCENAQMSSNHEVPGLCSHFRRGHSSFSESEIVVVALEDSVPVAHWWVLQIAPT